MAQAQVFKLALAGRLAMLSNMAVYAGVGAFWAVAGTSMLSAVFAGCLFLLALWAGLNWAGLNLILRRNVAGIGSDAVTVFGLLGQRTDIPFVALQGHRLEAGRRVGGLFWTKPGQATEAYTPVSQRMTGDAAAAEFRAALLARVPVLLSRLDKNGVPA